MRRVTAILLQEKNFGPNVIYNVFVTQAEAHPKHWITYKYNEFKQYVLSMPYGTDILLVKVSRTHFVHEFYFFRKSLGYF